MKETNITDRLTYLAEQFDVFEIDGDGSPVEKKIKSLEEDGYTVSPVITGEGEVIALCSIKTNEKNRVLKKVSVSLNVFSNIISADPSDNKMYIQWMLNVFTRLIKIGDKESILSGKRFVCEDLPQAKTYLVLFEDNKRKKKFKDLCLSSYILKHISDPTNINQYKSLSQLFDAIDPFIEREPSAIERTMNKFVEAGQAEIPVKDRNFTLFIPKTTSANVIFGKFANWCTAIEGNGRFNSYTKNYKKPNGKDSNIYIIINNDFFKGESKELYQIHFETEQIKDRTNGQNINLFDAVIKNSEAIDNFFYEELIEMAKGFKKGVKENIYLNYLVKFGHSESLFELILEDAPFINLQDMTIPRLPDLSRFKNVDELTLLNCKITELHWSVGNLDKLELMILTNNRLKSLPKEIARLKNLVFLNIIGNNINQIPDEIAELDKSNGGSLHRLSVRREEIGDENYKKLRRLLPETLID